MEAFNYTLILVLQCLLLLYDLFVNACIDFINPENVIQLVLFILQDVCIVFQLIVLFLELFNTSSFQAGFVAIMLQQFKMTLLITVLYLTLSVGLHSWTMALRWEDTSAYVWGMGGYYFLYVLQRAWSAIYYYFYKRTALKLGDVKYYENTDWLRRRLSLQHRMTVTG